MSVRYTDILKDQAGNGLPGAFVVVRNYPSGTLAAITDDSGSVIGNSVVVTDASGAYAFNATPGFYTLEFRLIVNEPARKVVLVDMNFDVTAGRQTAIAGSKAKVDFVYDSPAFPIENEGSIYPTAVYIRHGFNHTFVNGDGGVGSPAATVFALANANGTTADATALIGDAVARVPGAVAFGGNLIARSDSGATTAKLVPLELDLEPHASGVTASGSIGLPINIFNDPVAPATAVQINGINGGRWKNGFVTAEIRDAHYAVGSGNATTSICFINTVYGIFSDTAIVLGKGISQGISLGGAGSGTSPYLFGDTSNRIAMQLGSAQNFRVYKADGSTIAWELDATNKTLFAGSTTVASLPAAGTVGRRAFVTDANATTFASVVAAGGSNKVPVYDDGSAWRIG